MKEAKASTEPGQAFFKMSRSLLKAQDLNFTEKALVAVLGLYDWGNGRGCWPCNATLIEGMGLVDDGPDGSSQRCIRRLISGLAAKGYARVVKVKRCPTNRTGRVIHLTPKAFGTEGQPGQICPGDACTPDKIRPVDPDKFVRSDPDKFVPQTDPVLTDPGTDPSSADDDRSKSPDGEKTGRAVVAERLAAQVRGTFKAKGTARKIEAAIPRWLAWIGDQLPDPHKTIASAIAKASTIGLDPGREVGYVNACIESALNNPRTKANPVPVPKPAGEIIRKHAQESKAAERQDAELRGRWHGELTDAERGQIERDVRENPIVRRFPKLLEAYCFAAMDERYPAQQWLQQA